MPSRTCVEGNPPAAVGLPAPPVGSVVLPADLAALPGRSRTRSADALKTAPMPPNDHKPPPQAAAPASRVASEIGLAVLRRRLRDLRILTLEIRPSRHAWWLYLAVMVPIAIAYLAGPLNAGPVFNAIGF